MMDDLVFFVMCAISVLIGIHLGFNLANATKLNNSKELPLSDEEAGVTKRGIYVEEHQNKLFAYDIKTHQFLCSFTNYKDLHNTLTTIDSTSTWVFYEDSRVIIESYMRRHDGTNNSI